MKFDYYAFFVSEHYLSALINGDYSGLSDQEEAELNAWIDSLPVTGHFDVIDGEGGFHLCDICNLHAHTHQIRLYFQTQEATQ